MIRPLLVVLALLRVACSFGQVTYGNEWIDHERQYWRFEVYSTGLHRLDSATLAASGFPIATVDPKDLMLFGREEQVPLYIQGGDDGVLNAGDLIEFVGRRNDGWIDTRMYGSPQQHANPYYSQFNDTIRYFLTWNPDPSVAKLRVVPYENTDITSHTLRAWAWGLSVRPCADFYWPGKIERPYNATSGLMLESEGWGGGALYTTAGPTELNVTTPTPRAFVSSLAPMAQISITTAALSNDGGESWDDHHLRIYAGGGLSTLFIDTIFRGSRVVRSSFEVSTVTMPNSFTARFFVPHDLTDSGQVGVFSPNYLDWQTPAAILVRYPRDLNFISEPVDIWVQNQPGEDVARLGLGSFTGTPIIYADGDTVRRILPTQVPDWQALVPAHADSTTTHAFICAESAIRSIPGLVPVNGTGYFVDYGAMDPDSAFLMVAHRSLWNGATAYANYRSGAAPEPTPTVLADVDELYDQFGGGVPKSSVAIRMWCKYLLDTWSTDPSGLFLVGKSVITPKTVIYGQGYRPDANGAYARCLVPSYGYPACDQCFTIGLNFDPRRVEIPVGRLSATHDQQVLDYLDKVISFEDNQTPPAAWMKNIVHLSGGFDAEEQDLLASYLNSLEPLVDETTSFGGQVTAFRRNSSGIFATAAADSVRNLIENGVTLMNFFAHAYSENFDITIDDPDNYDWHGRYPMVIGNSCYIGNVHLNADLASTSEDWVMRDQAGPIAFLAATDQGFAWVLGVYSSWFYRSIGSANYGRGIGEHMRHAAFNMLGTADMYSTYTAHTMTLQGDPILVLNSPEQPDFEVTNADILFDPATVNADVDTFSVKVVVRNVGRIITDDVGVQLTRTSAGFAAPVVYSLVLDTMGYQDTAIFRVPTLAFAGGQGVNQFSVRVDLDPDLIDEFDNSSNNQASTTLFITSGDLVPTYPYNYAIVPDSGPMLKASTGDPLAPPRVYVFQIDTTDLFNSPVMETTTITAPGGVVSWQPVTVYNVDALQDSVVYYWRCSIDSTGNGGYTWYERSFQFIPNKRGWGQAHYFQFKNDDYSSVVYDRPDRDFEFTSAPHEIAAWTPGNTFAEPIGWRFDLENEDYGGCSGAPSWHVAVVDPYTFEAWGTRWTDNSAVPPVTYNPDHAFGNQNDLSACRNRVMKYFAFRQNSPEQMLAMEAMLNGIPDGHHILMFTWLYVSQIGMGAAPGLIPYMQNELGVPFSTMQDSVPYIFYVRKGDLGTFVDTVGTTSTSRLSLLALIESAGDRGFITTMEAGPAESWSALYWNELPYDANDSTVIQLKGVTAFGAEVDLAEFPSEQDSVPDLGALVDAQVYPKLRLRGKFHDLNATEPKPAYLQRWQLLHQPVPECAIDPPLGYYQALDGWFQGQQAAVAVAVHNISEFDMDSLLMAAWVIDRHNERRVVHYRRNAPLPAGATQIDTIRFSTLDMGGANTLVVEANPIDTITNVYDQAEQYHFNNIAQWRFDVSVDRENPLLDVTFDGVHILDGDIVSARPEIEISLNDENTVLLLDSPADTVQFKVFLTRPGGSGERIYFRDGAGNENLQFIPADGPENEARIFYRPVFPVDGKYVMTVQAQDLSSNDSGDDDYKVAFEVINRTTITEVLNYPNPFTTSTRFVFTLTGTEIPTYMKIQIMTITGKVVREIRMHELGPLHVGRNITEFAWDGTDEFGDRLARGVYLYRVIAQMNGEDIEYRSTDAASYFTKGFGKMYKL
ncbi:MAG: hypothetical protein JNL43_08620 [Flavobacteriales bacterium]|nr:hypothetical protein [Flavobacteriales bacterium]